MAIDSRLLIDITCCEEDYFLAGGKDCRESFPTILKEIKKIITRIFQCGKKPLVETHFQPKLYWEELKRTGKNGIPSSVTGSLEFSNVTIYCGYDPETCASEPTKDFMLAFESEFRKMLEEKWKIDPGAFRFDLSQWDLAKEPDDTLSHRLIDGVFTFSYGEE